MMELTEAARPLTGRTSLEDWQSSPVGAPLLSALLARKGIDESSLAPALRLSLASFVEISRGQVTQDEVDELVRDANDGELVVDEDGATGSAARFMNKTVIVTGAASGIGRATTQRIIAEGGRVIAVDLFAERLSELSAAHPEGSIVTVRADVTDPQSVQEIVTAAGDAPIDGLANVAGITDGHRPLHETSDEIWQKVMAVNVDGPFRLTRALIPLMRGRKGGAVVNVASEASMRGNAAGTAYTVSKHAIVGLTRSAAFLYAPDNIRINAVAPGPVATGIEGAFASEFSERRIGPFMRMIPPVADPAAIAASLTWLLSDDSSNVNGVVLPSDGGWSVQ